MYTINFAPSSQSAAVSLRHRATSSEFEQPLTSLFHTLDWCSMNLPRDEEDYSTVFFDLLSTPQCRETISKREKTSSARRKPTRRRAAPAMHILFLGNQHTPTDAPETVKSN